MKFTHDSSWIRYEPSSAMPQELAPVQIMVVGNDQPWLQSAIHLVSNEKTICCIHYIEALHAIRHFDESSLPIHGAIILLEPADQHHGVLTQKLLSKSASLPMVFVHSSNLEDGWTARSSINVEDALLLSKNKGAKAAFNYLLGMHAQHQRHLQSKRNKKRFSAIEPLPDLKTEIHTIIKEALYRCDGNRSKAAHMIGISRQALCKRLAKMKQPP